jgi:exo-rhamnogalacturonan lyase-like protein
MTYPRIPGLAFAAAVIALGPYSQTHGAAPNPVPLHQLDGAPAGLDQEVSWGVPWPRGAVVPGTAFALADGQGKSLAVQAWPLAYWPDGTLKWTGLAAVLPAGTDRSLTLTPGAASASPAAAGLTVIAGDRTVTVDTGPMQCILPLAGQNLVDSIKLAGREIARDGQLVGILQSGPETNPEDTPPREKFFSLVKKVTVEQSGPVRAVVKVEGVHRTATSGREWLPFTVRLYFYAGQTQVRLVHTIVFDGDQEKDFVRGLGIQFAVPLREQPQNREVRFAGENGGLWSEPLQPGGGSAEQEAGKPFVSRRGFSQNAIWDDFKLVQPNPNGFTIVKRTNPRSTWLFSAAGKRAPGYAYVGDLSGGFGISIKNFWQSFPAALEVRQASSSAAELIAWLWSPDGPEMDMRHYDTHAHGLLASYEDVQPGMSTAFGVARTSDLTLFPGGLLPSREAAVAMAEAGSVRPLLACSPDYLHSTGVFGVWSLPDRSTPFKIAIEDGLDSVLAYYERQVDERNWYGFWQFGDFMHSYSAPRHVWHYDWGGHAWDNTELGTSLWLWDSYLRSGRADLFRLAEAHARNTSETDVYHLGPMAGLGSRHNVIKWGDGAKEARISQAAHWRAFYYLTTDERTGDIMHEVARADLAAAKYDPMREAEPPVPGEPVYPARIRIGPDWFAFAGNWMTEWERTGDTQWRDRILAGVNSLMKMPYWLQSGQLHGLNPDLPGGGIGLLKGGGAQLVGYDVATGELTPIRDPVTKGSVPVSYNLATIQGGGEVMFELLPLLGRDDFTKAWTQYCRLGSAPPGTPRGQTEAVLAAALTRDRTTGNEGADASYVLTGQSGPRLAAYAYAQTRNPAFAKAAIAEMLNLAGGSAVPHEVSGDLSLSPVEEAAGVSTNEAAQTGLTEIEVLELCQDQLPTAAPPPRAPRRGRPGGYYGDGPPPGPDGGAPRP